MGDWGHGNGSSRLESAGLVSASSFGTQVTAAGSVNVKGAYAQLIASTAFESDWALIVVRNHTENASQSVLLDLAIGAAASEQVIVANLLAGRVSGGGQRPTVAYLIPLSIPAGSRIAARIQATMANYITRVSVHLVARNFLTPQPHSKIATYGANTADSGGVSVDPGGTINTMGSWVEMTASCDEVKWLCIAHGNGGNNLVTADLIGEVGIGAGGSEAAILSFTMPIHDSALSAQLNAVCLPVYIPAGTRIAMRIQSTTATATARLADFVLIGAS